MNQNLVAIALVLLAILVLYAGEESVAVTQMPPPPPPSPYDERLNDLNKEAVESAYREQIKHLFLTWMRDATGQPQRAVTGAQNARRAYIDIMKELDKRSSSPAR